MRNFDEATIIDAVLQRVSAKSPACQPETAVDGSAMARPYYHLNYDFGLKADTATRRSGERAAATKINAGRSRCAVVDV